MKKLLPLLFVIITGFSFSQDTLTTTSDTRWKMFTYDIGNIFVGIGHSYARPFHWQGKQWTQFGGVMGGTALLYLIDDDTSRFISNQRESVPRGVRDYGTLYGGPENNLLLSGAVLMSGLIVKKEKLRRAGVLMVSSGISAGLLQQVTKYAIGRARPVSGKSKDTFQPFSSDRNFHSFFSGHTALAFTTAYALSKQFKSKWIKSGFYLIGAVPGISRVWDKQHWLTDFAIGVAVSIATVEAIDRYLDKKYAEKYAAGQKNVSWDLKFGPGQVGVTMSF